MRDSDLLLELLGAEDEAHVFEALQSRGLLKANEQWKYLGNMPNNQSVVLAQQSTPAAALVEKFTNAMDAILLKHCRAAGIDPRSDFAPSSMAKAVEKYFPELADTLKPQEVRAVAEQNIVLYATGSKARPSLSLYDAGEGQLPDNFAATFCSLIHASADGSYKGAIPFVQGRFNMGGTGVLPFCGDRLHVQLILSRVPNEVAKSTSHEWAFTLFCFFPSSQNPSWKYLVGPDGKILTAGSAPLALVPLAGAKSGEIPMPRERMVDSGTLIKMYDFKAPRSNICGELFKKLEDYLIQPAIPLRLIECRTEYQAKVMGVTIWDRLEAWGGDGKLEEGFEEGASIAIELETGETVPAEIRVFRAKHGDPESDSAPQTGLRALINGQSHAKRDASFFKTKAVDKEHIAGSLLVTLDCTQLGQESRNGLFMSNRETFRETPLLADLFRKLQKELKDHEALKQLNLRRYEEKVKNAVDDELGISALEDLLTEDPDLAKLFGTKASGKVAGDTAKEGGKPRDDEEPGGFVGQEFPTFIRRKDGSTEVQIEVPQGATSRTSFLTDMKNNYFSRKKFRGYWESSGDFTPTLHPFNGRLTCTCTLDKKAAVGTTWSTAITITDKKGSGPFNLKITATVVAAKEQTPPVHKDPPQPKGMEGPSRPDVKEDALGESARPLVIMQNPVTKKLQLVLNTTSSELAAAKASRAKEEEPAVSFVFKYGLALAAMSLLEHAKQSPKWAVNETECRDEVQAAVAGLARVIVPIALSLPKKLPKAK